MRLQLLPVPRRLGAVAARGHVAPASPAILRAVVEDAHAARIGAAADARELAEDERVGGGLDDRDDETGEGVAHGDEAACERAVGAEIDASRAGAAAEHAIDRGQPVDAPGV